MADPEHFLPQQLRDDLSSVYRTPRVPPDVDRMIISSARAQFVRRSRYSLLLRWGGGAAVAAALLAVALRLAVIPIAQDAVSPLASSTSQTQDINHDGQIDILDAFQLARQIEANASLGRQFDFNHDGFVSREDARTLAQSAVSLERGAVH